MKIKNIRPSLTLQDLKYGDRQTSWSVINPFIHPSILKLTQQLSVSINVSQALF